MTTICLNVSAKVEKSDHDGYCSGEDNEYDCQYLNKRVDFQLYCENVPKSGENFPIDLKDSRWQNIKMRFHPQLNGGSNYCCVSDTSIEHKLGKHESRVTLLSATVVS